ncbi:hypothetical protein IscW_ISCW011694, partial [Ixodes scapularis]
MNNRNIREPTDVRKSEGDRIGKDTGNRAIQRSAGEEDAKSRREGSSAKVRDGERRDWGAKEEAVGSERRKGWISRRLATAGCDKSVTARCHASRGTWQDDFLPWQNRGGDHSRKKKKKNILEGRNVEVEVGGGDAVETWRRGHKRMAREKSKTPLVQPARQINMAPIDWQAPTHVIKLRIDDADRYRAITPQYELHYKRQQGSWDLVRVAPPASVLGGSVPARSSVATVSASWSNGTRLTHELTGLFCGTQYHIYLVAVGDKGKSDPSDTVFARTQGGVPPSPKQDAFVSPNASSLTLRPGAWSGAGCPVSHLAVEYRLRDGTGPWLVASRALQPREGPMTLHHLRPDTWYSVRVTAHSEAGPAVAEYAVRTLPASAMLA